MLGRLIGHELPNLGVSPTIDSANIQPELSPAQQQAFTELYPDKIPDADVLRHSGKPVYDVSFNHRYTVSEKEMTEAQKMAWKSYQLYKLTLKVDRRDSVYQALTASDYTNMNPSHNWLGAPFAVIEPNPFFAEAFFGIRWYEHVISIGGATVWYNWMRTRPEVRNGILNVFMQKVACIWIYGLFEFNMGHRSIARLQGRLPNEPECYKYGVVETPQRLADKAKYWQKYKEYKEEWCRRWDYHVWGMRPGERHTFFSSCHWEPWPVLYNTKTDYPLRKNPFLLSATPINQLRLDTMLTYYWAPGANTIAEQQRPELNYLYRGGMAT